MNPLEQYPAIRQVLYTVQWIVNLVLGVLGVVFIALGDSPMWLLITVAAFNFVWSYTGITAAGNVASPVSTEAAAAAALRADQITASLRRHARAGGRPLMAPDDDTPGG